MCDDNVVWLRSHADGKYLIHTKLILSILTVGLLGARVCGVVGEQPTASPPKWARLNCVL